MFVIFLNRFMILQKHFVHELYATVYLPEDLNGKVKEAVDAFSELYMHYATVYSHLQSSSTTSSVTTASESSTPSFARSLARPFKKANLGKVGYYVLLPSLNMIHTCLVLLMLVSLCWLSCCVKLCCQLESSAR